VNFIFSVQKAFMADSDSDADDLLQKRTKTADEIKKEDEDYHEWMKSQKTDESSHKFDDLVR
jgi:hypothetical protein